MIVDNRGREVKPLLKVAYNFSGQIATGEVIRINRNTIYVRCEQPKHWAGRTSRVTSPRNLLVLEEDNA
jgi:hypothetical protein